MRVVLMCCSGLALVAGVAAPAAAQQIACGTPYAIAPGDTLASIAAQAYGRAEYQLIYLANTDVIGPDPNLIVVGTPLAIPCLDLGGDAQEVVEALPLDPDGVQPVVPVRPRHSDLPPLKVIGLADMAPFSGEGLPEGGLVAQMLRLAGDLAGLTLTDMTFAPDARAQLTALLPGGGYDIGFPWVRPDCEAASALPAEAQARCRSFVFSEPLIDLEIGLFTLAGSDYAGAASAEDLHGARICRPEGAFAGDLALRGLAEPQVSHIDAPDAAACLRGLLSGEVNAVPLDLSRAEAALAAVPGAARRVVQIAPMTQMVTLHAVAPRDDPAGRTALAQLDTAVRDLRRSGQWFSWAETLRAAAGTPEAASP